MKLAIVLSTHPARFEAAAFKGDLEQNLAHIAALGYHGVELAIRDPALVDQEHLLASLHRFGLELPAIGTGQAWGEEGLSFTDPDPAVRRAAVARLKSHLPLAARAGAFVIIGLVRGTLAPSVSPGQAADWMVQALQELAAAAAPLGVRFAIEPLNRYETALINTTAQALDLLHRVGAPNLGLLLDTFHMNIEELSIEDSIRLAGDRLLHFHVADSNRRHPGAGHLDFPAILRALTDLGYAGYLSGEFLPLPDPAAAANSIAHLRPLLPLL